MKVNICMPLSMLSLILLMVLHVTMIAPTGLNGTQDKASSAGDVLSNGTTTLSYQSTTDRERYSTSSTQSDDTTNTEQKLSTITTRTPTFNTRLSTTTRQKPTSSSTKVTTIRPTTPPFSSGSVAAVVIVVIILLLLIFVLIYKWITRRADQESSAPQLLLGVRDRVRGGVRSLEERLGLSLWPGKRAGDDEEEDDEVKRVEGGASVEGVKAGRVSVDDEGNSSSDYSSLEGVDLRERAKKLEEEKMENGEKKEEVATLNGGNQSDTSGDSSETDEEEQKRVTSGEGEMSDLTIL